MPQCTSNNSSRTDNSKEERFFEQRIRREALSKVLERIDTKYPYQCAGITRDALWQQFGIDARKRFSYYRTRLKLQKNKDVFFETLELKLALASSLFSSDTPEEANEAMYAFGHPNIIVPKRLRRKIDDYRDACYRVIAHVYGKYSISASDDFMKREKMCVDRLHEALKYIEKEEPELYAYFFGKQSKN